MIKWIFGLISFTNILINMDHGILPACTFQVQEEFSIGEVQMGILGSVVYLGIIVMGIYVGRLYQKANTKIMCLVGLICLAVSLFLFVLSRIYWLAVASRFLTGVFQVFLLVYFPVWIDKSGGQNATLWLTLLQVGVPLGICAGYGMTSLLVTMGHSWKYSFYIQIGILSVAIVGFFFIDSDSLSVKEVVERRNSIEDQLLIREGTVKKKPTYFQLVGILLKNKMYMISILTMSVMLFVSTGIQFWMTTYFIQVLGFPPERVNIAYAVVSITGPTLGAGFGGYIISSIGGYSQPRSIYFIFVFGSVGMANAVIIPFVSQFWTVSILLWLVLFFGGAMVPGLTGMIMSSVQPEVRSFGNSNGQIIKNTLGYFPSPFLYGLVNHLTGKPRAGITFIMFWGLLAPLLLGVGCLITFLEGKKALQAQDVFVAGHQGEPVSPLRPPRANQSLITDHSSTLQPTQVLGQ